MTDPEELLEAVQAGAEAIRESFEGADDDWWPVFHFVKKSGEHGMGMADPQILSSDGLKDEFARALVALIHEEEVAAIALLTSAWMVVTPPDERVKGADGHALPPGTRYEDLLDGVRPSEHPLRQETLIVNVLSADEDIMATAAIMRDGENPPVLDEWRVMHDSVTVGGRFFDPLKAALKEVNDGDDNGG